MTTSPVTTTTPDDAFYIFKVVLSRLLSTGAPKVVERTGAALRSVIESDYAGTIRRKMDDVYRNPGAGRGEKVERESRAAFIVRTFPHPCRGLSRIDQELDVTERPGRVRVAHGSPRERPARLICDTPDVPSGGGRRGARERLVALEHRAKVPVDAARGRRAAVQPAFAAKASYVAGGRVQGRVVRP
jgi:COG4 transport protein